LDFKVTSWSAAAATLFGLDESEAIGKTPLELFPGVDGWSDLTELRHSMLARRTGARAVADATTKLGRSIALDWCHAPVLDAAGVPTGFASAASLMTGTDRGDRRATLRDPLTGVPSAVVFRDRLERAICGARRSRTDFAIFAIDLDHRGSLNGGLGHRTRDAVLRGVAQRLTAALREADSLGRLDGDRFGVLAAVDGKTGASIAAQRILDCFSEPFEVDGQRHVQSASVGIALFPDDGRDARTLLRNADGATAAAKQLGRDVYQFHEAVAGAPERASLERDLRAATERGQLELHYQPQVDLRSGAIMGVEALVRWRHPQRGLLMPSDFVALAEETGLIVPIGAWVLRTACATMRAWNVAGVWVPRITVNVSGRELRRRMVDEVAQVLCDTNVDPSVLELEMTETVTMRSSEVQPRLLDELNSFGVRLAIDDFGVGYSSLAYLQRFPIDTLKIDRLFVRDCLTDGANAAIVEAIVTMAHGMELEVVAEGVESAEQAAFLRGLGCDGAQGYYFGRPMPVDEFTVLAARSPEFAAAD